MSSEQPPDIPVKRKRGRPPKPKLPPPSKTFEKYGREWPKGTSEITIELHCFLNGRTQEEGGLGKFGHFKEATAILWGANNDRLKFDWHPWAERMIELACEQQYLAVSGCANSGKSDAYAVWAIVNFLAAPLDTMVLITSTSLKQSHGRIWGRIEEYWIAAQHVCGGALPGKLVSSVGMIRFEDRTGEYKTSSRCGIHLIAGEKKKEKESIGKMIGLKQARVIFVADELPELSHAILEAAFSNLSANPYFQLIGIGNPASIYDPHGILSRPRNGWSSVSIGDDEWVTEKGYHIRFDALKSPNVLAGRTLFSYLPTKAKIEAAKHVTGGEESSGFYRMWRGYWNPNGTLESIVTEADILKFNCEDTKVTWKPGTKPTKVTAIDPAFTNGGDRSVRFVAEFGEEAVTGKMVLLFKHHEALYDDVTKKNEPHNFQIARQFKEKSEAEGITADRAATDDTGAAAFGDIVHVVWSKAVTRINFGGKATERPVSAEDKRSRACEKYANRVTELWCSIRAFMRAGQIKGISPDLGLELTMRLMKQVQSGAVIKEQVERKEDMRARTNGKSPDIADAALILLDFVRTKYKFRAAGAKNIVVSEKKNWKDFRMRMDKVNATTHLDRAA